MSYKLLPLTESSVFYSNYVLVLLDNFLWGLFLLGVAGIGSQCASPKKDCARFTVSKLPRMGCIESCLVICGQHEGHKVRTAPMAGARRPPAQKEIGN